MYLPRQFDEPRIDVMHELIRMRPLATVVSASPDGIEANHIPMHLSAEPGPFGTLRGHVARANPMWRDAADAQVLAIFHGPEAYISPSWYATKKEGGKVVPTWNYVAVHAYGRLKIVDDASWIRTQLEALTDHNEARFAEPWKVSDAPHDFTDKLIGAVVGIEIEIVKLQGKWKVSQNQPQENRASVVRGLEESGNPSSALMAEWIKAASKEA